MENYILLITLIGLAALGMAWMPAITKFTGVSYAIIYVLAGALVYTLFPGKLPVPNPEEHESLTLRLSEMVVIISLMGTGIKIDRVFSFRYWKAPIRLIIVAMVLCVGACALMGYNLLGLDIASAALLGAVLAPTDPVLASDVQVGPPNDVKRSETKFTLTAEGGLNDGMAFPFTWLAITLAISTNWSSQALFTWFAYDCLYRIGVGIVVGYVIGKVIGFIVFEASKKFSFLKTNDGFLAISLTLLVYGITEMIHGYGFIAVFICAITLRHSEKADDYHHELHTVTDQSERLLVAVLLILFGGSLVSGILYVLTFKMVLFSLLFLFVIRPIAAYLSLLFIPLHFREKLAISFFGIRGMGSIFYLAFAFSKAHFSYQRELWAIVAFTILISILIHGITATPAMKYLTKKMQ